MGFFRNPLLKYALTCYDKGTLTDSFRTAKIRLIPKKGEIKSIKNWRPISLLNCFYKIISRALTFRLKKYMDKLTSVGQKGYSTNKQCQEVLISLIDSIQLCKKKNIRSALLSLDIKKAFDSLSHTYLKNVLTFFNFGPNIIRWLTLISTNRRACLILENGILGSIFELERGNAQGDTISPFLFNLGYQILLFKINFDLQIAGIIEVPDPPDHLDPLPISVSRSPRKSFSFADDTNILTRMETGSLLRIITILSNFKNISGLECNVEKSFLMQIGSNLEIPNEIQDLNFHITDKVTILGLTIEGDSGVFNESLDKIREKILNQINFWTRFNLSLPGRINIAKTMLYSQICYLGCFLPFPEANIKSLENLITGYVSGNLRIGKKRFFSSPESGGLGLFELKTFLDSLKCAWVKRASDLNEIWKIKLYNKSLGSVFNIRHSRYDVNSEPIISEIARCFEKFYIAFSTKNTNYKKVKIFENNALTFGLDNARVIDGFLFGVDFYNQNRRQLENLSFTDFYTGDRPKSYETFLREKNLNISPQQFLTCVGVAATAHIRYNKGDCTDLPVTLNKFKVPTKFYRKIMIPDPAPFVTHNINKFAESTETIIGYEASKILNSSWNIGYFSNSTRTFLFKLHSNILGYNQSVSHFIRGHSNNCTFCDLVNNPEPEPETPLHLFYNCMTVETLRDEFFDWVMSTTIGAGGPVTRQEFFTIFKRENSCLNKILFLITKLFMKYIWDCKVRKSMPNLRLLRVYIKSEINIFSKCKRGFNEILAISGINLDRE